MTDIVDAEYTMEPKEEVKPLTLGQFLTDMSRFPLESEVYVSIMGAGITIPIVEAITVDTTNQETNEAKKVTVLMIPYVFARHAMDMVEQRLQSNEGH